MIQTTTNGSALKQSTYFHVVTGSEGAAFSWTFATSSAAGGITAYSGVDVTAPPRPVDASGSQPTTGSTTNVVAPSIATNVAGDLLIGAFGSAINAAFSPPAGMIERGEISSTKGKSKVAMELTDQILGAPGSTGTRTATTDKAAIGIGQLFALRPSGSQAPVTVPDAPTGLVATRGNETVTLSWSAPTHDGGSQITGYNVYRGTTPGGEGTVPFATSTSTDYTDNDVTNGVTYYYVIRAVNSIGAGSPSSEVSGTPATVPDAPATLTADRAGKGPSTLPGRPPIVVDTGHQLQGLPRHVERRRDPPDDGRKRDLVGRPGVRRHVLLQGERNERCRRRGALPRSVRDSHASASPLGAECAAGPLRIACEWQGHPDELGHPRFERGQSDHRLSRVPRDSQRWGNLAHDRRQRNELQGHVDNPGRGLLLQGGRRQQCW